jgi:hypothetical protein
LIEKDTYQDIRIKGETVWKGRRECESRWKAIKPFLERYKNHKSFKILDFGANYGYFSWRIKEEFPHAEIDMVDSREMLKLIYNINQPENMAIFENMDTDTLKEHAETHHYDLILAMSILHHFDNYDEILSILQEMSDTVLLEIDYPDKPNFKGNQEDVFQHVMTKHPIKLNDWVAHDRPIYYLSKYEVPINGIVASGSGLAKQSVNVINSLFKWVGCEMYPGTLNIGIERGIYFNWRLHLDSYVVCEMFLFGLPVMMIRDTKLKYDPSRLELLSPHCLRDYFNLEDNSAVVLSVDVHNEWFGDV